MTVITGLIGARFCTCQDLTRTMMPRPCALGMQAASGKDELRWSDRTSLPTGWKGKDELRSLECLSQVLRWWAQRT